MQRSDDGKASSSGQDGETGGWRLRIRKVIKVVSAQKRIFRSRDEVKKTPEARLPGISSRSSSGSDKFTESSRVPHEVLEGNQKSSEDFVQETFQTEDIFDINSQTENVVIRRGSKTTFIDVKIDDRMNTDTKGKSQNFNRGNIVNELKDASANSSPLASPFDIVKERVEEIDKELKTINDNFFLDYKYNKEHTRDLSSNVSGKEELEQEPTKLLISPTESSKAGMSSIDSKILKENTKNTIFHGGQDGTSKFSEESSKIGNEIQDTPIIVKEPVVSAENVNVNSALNDPQEKIYQCSEETLKEGNERIEGAKENQLIIYNKFHNENNNLNLKVYDTHERILPSLEITVDNNNPEIVEEGKFNIYNKYGVGKVNETLFSLNNQLNSLIYSEALEEDSFQGVKESQRMFHKKKSKHCEKDNIISISHDVEEWRLQFSNCVDEEPLPTRVEPDRKLHEEIGMGSSLSEDTDGFQVNIVEEPPPNMFQELLRDENFIRGAQNIKDDPISHDSKDKLSLLSKDMNKHIFQVEKANHEFFQNSKNSEEISKSSNPLFLPTENGPLNSEDKDEILTNRSVDFDEENVFWEPTFSLLHAESNTILQDDMEGPDYPATSPQNEPVWVRMVEDGIRDEFKPSLDDLQSSPSSSSHVDTDKLTADGSSKPSHESSLFSSPSLPDLPSKQQMYFGPGHLQFKWFPMP